MLSKKEKRSFSNGPLRDQWEKRAQSVADQCKQEAEWKEKSSLKLWEYVMFVFQQQNVKETPIHLSIQVHHTKIHVAEWPHGPDTPNSNKFKTKAVKLNNLLEATARNKQCKNPSGYSARV